ncbi:MAG: zinc ABC transporter substrate-binding protein [Caldilineaceae bacterium]|nr:zinc ABC transporter substrate-binding protein [Caldilineaceae bacterium]
MVRYAWLFSLLLLLCLTGCDGASPRAKSEADRGKATDVHRQEPGKKLPSLAPLTLAPGDKLFVVATTSLVADVVARVGGDAIQLVGLLPPGADPHAYQPTPDDLRAISDAQLIFVNGLGLEEALASILEEAGAKTVSVNVGVSVLRKEDGQGAAAGTEEGDHHADGNPHTWWSVDAVERWTRNIEQALSAVDPAHAAAYAANAEAYRVELAALRVDLKALIGQIPVAERKLATDHDTLAYFAQAFDFQVVGLVVPSFSTLAEPSARHLAQLQDQIRSGNVRAIFVGSTVNPRQAAQLAQDLGIRVVPIYTDALSGPDGPAPTYLDFMRYNGQLIVEGLREGE